MQKITKRHLFFNGLIFIVKLNIHSVFSYDCRVFIGIKKLLALIDMVRQTDQKGRVMKFLIKMEEEGCLDLGTMIH